MIKRFEIRKILSEAYFILDDDSNSQNIQELVSNDNGKLFDTRFPVGPYANYIFSYKNFKVVYVDSSIVSILGLQEKEILANPMNEFFSEIMAPEHVYTALRFSKLVFEFIQQHQGKDICVNFEFNILKNKTKLSRILCQYKVLSYNSLGEPVYLFGSFTDISHFCYFGASTLTLLLDSQMFMYATSTKEELLKGLSIDITERELEILSLRRQGLRVKQIAEQSGLSYLTVYSLLRDIKKKTDMEIIPLIDLLREKGLFN